MQQLEYELSNTQTNLEQATHNLEEKEKALTNVSHFLLTFFVVKKSLRRNKTKESMEWLKI